MHSWELTDDMNDTLAGLNVGLNNLRHVVARVASSLLENLATLADGATVLSVRHLGLSSTEEILGLDNLVNGMEQQDVGE